jgi:UDP-N-acetylmuramate--alanine ligase
LWQEFCGAFALADVVLLADVYVARGKEIENINSERLAAEIEHGNVHYLKGAAATLPEQVFAYIQPGDLVLTVGAGDVTTVGPELVKYLRGKQTHGISI